MYFDFPRWDIDGYVVYKISPNGKREEILKYTTSNSANNETICITKTIKFLENIERELNENIIIAELHHLEQSYCIQEIIDNVNNASTYIDNCIFQCNKENNCNNIRQYIKYLKDNEYNSMMDEGY